MSSFDQALSYFDNFTYRFKSRFTKVTKFYIQPPEIKGQYFIQTSGSHDQQDCFAHICKNIIKSSSARTTRPILKTLYVTFKLEYYKDFPNDDLDLM